MRGCRKVGTVRVSTCCSRIQQAGCFEQGQSTDRAPAHMPIVHPRGPADTVSQADSSLSDVGEGRRVGHKNPVMWEYSAYPMCLGSQHQLFHMVKRTNKRTFIQFLHDCLVGMIVYILVHIEASECIESFGVIERSRKRVHIENWKEVCSTKYAVDMNHRQVAGGTTRIIRGNNPHPIIWVRLISEHGEPMDKSTGVCLAVE